MHFCSGLLMQNHSGLDRTAINAILAAAGYHFRLLLTWLRLLLRLLLAMLFRSIRPLHT